MHQTMIMPISVLGLAALTCFGIKQVRTTSEVSPVSAPRPERPHPEASQAQA